MSYASISGMGVLMITTFVQRNSVGGSVLTIPPHGGNPPGVARCACTPLSGQEMQPSSEDWSLEMMPGTAPHPVGCIDIRPRTKTSHCQQHHVPRIPFAVITNSSALLIKSSTSACEVAPDTSYCSMLRVCLALPCQICRVRRDQNHRQTLILRIVGH